MFFFCQMNGTIYYIMPSSRTVTALVFSRKNIQEADRLVTFFTREEGLIRVIAKGVRKIPSSRGGHLEPCTRVSAIIHESRTGIYAGNVETEEYFHGLREDADAFSRACEQVRLFHRLFDVHQPVPELFDALMHAWRAYPDLSQEKRIVMDATISLMLVQYAGVMPDARLWNTNNANDRSFAVMKYLAEHPDHASRIALSVQDAGQLQRAMKNLLARTLADAAMVYS